MALEHRQGVLGHVAVAVVEAESDEPVDRLAAPQGVHGRHHVERAVAVRVQRSHLLVEPCRRDGERVAIVGDAVVEEDPQPRSLRSPACPPAPPSVRGSGPV